MQHVQQKIRSLSFSVDHELLSFNTFIRGTFQNSKTVDHVNFSYLYCIRGWRHRRNKACSLFYTFWCEICIINASGNVYSSYVHNDFRERADDAVTTCWNIGLDYILVDMWSQSSCCYVKAKVTVNTFKMFSFSLIFLMLKFTQTTRAKWFLKSALESIDE